MEKAIDMIKILFSYGIDIIVIISILAMVQGLKKYFKLKDKIAFSILLISGLVVGIVKITMGLVSEELYFTVIFGYSGITSLLYVAIDLFLPAIKNKYFPSSKQINNDEK